MKLNFQDGQVDLAGPHPMLDSILVNIKQLERMQKKRDTPQIRKDIAGYKMLLEASEATINKFLSLKAEMYIGLRSKKWNDDLVAEMKSRGMWEDRVQS